MRILVLLMVALLISQPVHAQQVLKGKASKRTSVKVGNWLSKAFVMTEHADAYLRLPQISKLEGFESPEQESKFDHYLLALGWNVPMTKQNIPWCHYNYVQLEGSISLTGASHDGYDSELKPRILGVYPTVEMVDVAVTNTNFVQGQIEPNWSGFSVASLTASNTNVANFNIQVPVLTGLNTSDNLVRWTYYPAKGQKVILGNKTCFVLLQVPKNSSKSCVVFESALRYKLNMSMPFTHSEYARNCSIDLRASQPLETMMRSKVFEVADSDIKAFLKTFTNQKSAATEVKAP